MSKYILKRILISIPVLIGVIFIIFIMLNVVPGDPITLMMGEHIKPDLIEQFRVRMGTLLLWKVKNQQKEKI